VNLAVLTTALNRAVKHRLLTRNPVASLPRQWWTRRVKAWNPGTARSIQAFMAKPLTAPDSSCPAERSRGLHGIRGTIGGVAGQRSIILNRRHRFSSEQGRRRVLAEELGHVLLGHQLVESSQPGKPTMGLLEERCLIYEGNAPAPHSLALFDRRCLPNIVNRNDRDGY
jgi:hypothetical protein